MWKVLKEYFVSKLNRKKRDKTQNCGCNRLRDGATIARFTALVHGDRSRLHRRPNARTLRSSLAIVTFSFVTLSRCGARCK